MTMKRFINAIPKLAFIYLPLCIIAVDAAVLVSERLQPETEKAIRMVQESPSRKEEFTIQQHFYTTVYYQKSKGEDVTIEGWDADQPAGPNTPVMVVFGYEDSQGDHTALWEVDVKKKKITPRNEMAVNISRQ